MKKLVDLVKKIPWWGYIYAACLALFQVGVYFIMNKVNSGRIDLINSVNVKIPAIDDKIPLIVNSSVFYFLSYPYWIISALIISATAPKKNLINFAVGYGIAIIIGLFFFIFMPTYLDREAEGVLEVVSNPGFTNQLSLFIYNNDGGSVGTNLFPSFHCLLSMYVCLGVVFEKKVRRGWKGFSVMAVIIICTCTLTTKQHYFLDVIGGVGLAAIMYFVTALINPARWFEKKKVSQN